MPTLQGRGPFSYESLNFNSGNTYALNAGSATAPKTQFDSTNGETLEVLANDVLLEGDGSVANSSDAAAQSPAHGFFVNSLTTPTSITLVSNITSGQTVLIRRISNRATPQIDFAPGSVIRESDLDDSTNQTLHVAQEAIDIALQSMVMDVDDKWDAQTSSTNRVIKGVADGVANNDAVNKSQLTATEVTTNAYKEDTEDYKLETADWATKVNGVVNTYTDNVAQSDGTDQSAKAYAIGGTGVTTTASKGAAKEWATTTGGAVDTSEYSAKEYAVGTTATSSKTYATKVDGAVTGTDFSSKAWAIGGTNVTTTASRGSAKEWATATGLVDTASYSAKEYSQSTTAGTSTYGGSAKGWASTAVDTAVPGAGSSDRSALHYSTDASNSALAAKNSANAVANTFDAFDDVYLGTMSDSSTQGTNPTTNGTWAKDSSAITVVSGTNIKVGQVVTGTGMPSPPPNVISVAGTAVVVSENMAAAGSGVALTFTGYGVYGTYNGTKDGPTTDNDNGALADGMLYFNSTDNNMMVYKTTGATWIAATSSGGVSLVMHKATASGSETSLAASDFSPTLSYEANNIILFLNGVKLDATDYTASSGTTITGLSALSASDEVVVLAFKTFEVADAVSAASGGTFNGNVSFADNNITNVGSIALDSIVADGTNITISSDMETGTNKKIKQKGAFMQSSTHQALFLGV